MMLQEKVKENALVIDLDFIYQNPNSNSQQHIENTAEDSTQEKRKITRTVCGSCCAVVIPPSLLSFVPHDRLYSDSIQLTIR